MMGGLTKLLPVAALGATVAGGSGELQEVGEACINAALQVKTSMETRGLAKSVYLDCFVHEDPLPSDFSAYARRVMDSEKSDPAIDSWETPYRLEKEDDTFFVISCGPDARCGTEDDIRAIVIGPKGRRQGKR